MRRITTREHAQQIHNGIPLIIPRGGHSWTHFPIWSLASAYGKGVWVLSSAGKLKTRTPGSIILRSFPYPTTPTHVPSIHLYGDMWYACWLNWVCVHLRHQSDDNSNLMERSLLLHRPHHPDWHINLRSCCWCWNMKTGRERKILTEFFWFYVNFLNSLTFIWNLQK